MCPRERIFPGYVDGFRTVMHGAGEEAILFEVLSERSRIMTKGKYVLVVDDDADSRGYLTAVLEDNGYESMTALDGEEALEKARESTPSIILLDLFMPGKSGMAFLNEIKQDESLKNVPIVVQSGASLMTGVDMKKYLEDPPYRDRKIKALGIDIDITPEAYLEKPVDREMLVEILQKLT